MADSKGLIDSPIGGGENRAPDTSAADLKKLADLTPDALNANRGTERGAAFIGESLRLHGAGRSILVDRNGAIIAGNKTAEAAGAAGLEDMIVVRTTGDRLVAVQRMDLELDSPEARALAIADNRASQLSLDWNLDVLQELEAAGSIDLGAFFNPAELSAMWPAQLLADEDDVPEPAAVAMSKLGDLYELGDHRLLCGDATKAGDVKRLLNHSKPALMVTDPPYGVEYDPRWRLESGVNKAHQVRAEGVVSNDDRADWRAAWLLFPGDVAYVWHSALHAGVVSASLEAAAFKIRSQIIWAKPALVIGRGQYHWQHEPCWVAQREEEPAPPIGFAREGEPCWYAVRKGATGHWAGDRKQSTIWDIPNMHRTQGSVDDGKTNHSTQNPVACMERPMLNNSRHGDAVYDPFGGSGTTLIAAEKTGRRCFMMELDPVYVDMIVARWEAATGKKATLNAGA